MKRQFFIAAGTLLAGSILFVSSCSKNDNGDSTAPVVTLLGQASDVIILNGSAWTDPGATATDDVDGTVTVTSDASSSNPNVNRANTYTITYTATDAAGNVGTATRTVRVKNEAEVYAGTYSVVDTAGGTEVFTYAQTIRIDSTVNNRVLFNKFADYANNSNIYAIMLGDGNLNIPLQSALSIGSGTDSCSIADHTFQSSGSTALIVNGFVLHYIDIKTNPVNCSGSTNCVAYFTK